MKWLLPLALVAACGGSKHATKSAAAEPPVEAPQTVADKIVAMLPVGAQIVVEIDAARLRANPVIGATFTRAVANPIDLPGDVPEPPLAIADTVVLAAYGVGTSNAATIVVIASPQPIPNATRIDDTLYAMGPSEWVGQLEARAALALGTTPISAPKELLALRGRAMPAKAPGASFRLTARLPFDARVALARSTGLESAPAQLSVWADVVDDFVIVVDADAVDPGEKVTKKATARLEALIRGALASLAAEPSMQLLGLSASIGRAKLSAGGSWIRTVIAIGPRHLQRVVERAAGMFEPPP